MFFPGSRYEKVGTYLVKRADGTTVPVTRLPLPDQRPVRGYFRRTGDTRPDLIAHHFLADPTAFWRLCDVNNAVVPDALAARDLVGVPAAGR